MPMRFLLLAAAALGATAPLVAQVAHPETWPVPPRPQPRNAPVEARVDALLRAMPVEDKVAQLIQPDIASIKPADLRDIRVGSILNGGNSAPNNDEIAPPSEWLKLADAFWTASVQPRPGHPTIPLIWGTDAVHGDNNIVGATLFPHNIGLGNARDPALMREIGRATAAETAATGLDWSFAPTLAVVQDDRWGRSYESYSEDPAVVASYAAPMVEGVQGVPGTKDFMGPGHVIATAKHFLGDGGTGGRDQGNTEVAEDTLRTVHGAGYPPAIGAGVLTVMASYSSWNGAKMHGNQSLLTGVLKQRMRFQGLVVGDWNAHAQLPGCTVDHCAAAINAGLDMFMISGDWRALYRNTLDDVKAGRISMARLDDAVRRILRVKALAGTLDAPRPSARATAGRFDMIGSPEHRAIARRAVRESLVLLKNEGGLLPLKATGHILVAGAAADDIAQQSGGWTITWQGTGVTNKDFPNGQSIWGGLSQAITAAGGTATYSPAGIWATKPDAAIVVFGEKPYAEMVGDRPTLEYSAADKRDLAMLRKLKAAGVPVVAVFLSGRPLWVNAELNASDAFVAAFLPGTEGAGIADVLLRRPDGTVSNDFSGKLSFSWPKRPDQYRLNHGDADYDPLFAFGYGLTYAHGGQVDVLDEARPVGLTGGMSDTVFARGTAPTGWTVRADAGLTVTNVDRRAQEDSRTLKWTGNAAWTIAPPSPLDWSRETNADLALVVEARGEAAGALSVVLATDSAPAPVSIAAALVKAGRARWSTIAIPLKCFSTPGFDPQRITALQVRGTAGAVATISDIRLASVPGSGDGCVF